MIDLQNLFKKTHHDSFFFEPLCPHHSVDMARLHGNSFHIPWTDGAFYAFLNEPSIFGFLARRVGSNAPLGFVLARHIAGEAEILTLVVDKKQRNKGIGFGLMQALLTKLKSLEARKLFLEVDETNQAALHLYTRLGFVSVAKRASYYVTAEGRSGAIVMNLTNF
jgi:[ribosomal protein S18]-alanine N-acetyltransferase